MKGLKALFAIAAITPLATLAQVPITTFEGDELKIPSLNLNNQNYKDLVVKYLGGMNFDVTQFQETTEPFFHYASKFESGKLVVNALELGEEIYADLLFDSAGGTRLNLSSFKGPVKELDFKETDFLLVEPKEWKSNESIYDSDNGVFITKRGAVLVSDSKTLDLDNDGLKDILIASVLFENDEFVDEKMPLLWLKNTGNGFESGDPEIFPDTHARTHIRSIHVADFNNDGQDDIFAASTGYDGRPFPGEANLLLLSDSQGSYQDASIDNLNFDYLGFTHGSDIGDINNDGHIDIATTDNCGPNGRISGARVLVNDGQAQFIQAAIKNTEAYDVPAIFGTFCSGIQVALIDLNSDGYDELIIGSYYRDLAEDRIYWNDKSGEFDLSKYTRVPEFKSFDGSYLYDTLAILGTDLNFDGNVDIIMSKSQRYEGMGLQFLINNGDETFTDVTDSYSPWLTSGPVSQQAIPYFISETDINSDGLPDLKLSYDKWGDEKFPHIWLRKKDGGYEEYPSANLPKVGWFWLIDYDHDGDQDLINRSQSFVKINGSGENVLNAVFEWRILENESL